MDIAGDFYFLCTFKLMIILIALVCIHCLPVQLDVELVMLLYLIWFLLLGALTKQLQKELIKFDAEYHDIAVNALFTEIPIDSNRWLKCIYFTTEDIPHKLLEYLHVMGNMYHNDLFERCWRKQCKMCNHLTTFNRVYRKVCMPVLDECKEILLSLQRKTMTLEDVDKYFQEFQQEINMENNLNLLCRGMRQCFPDIEVLPAKKWVHGVVAHIQEYKRINSYINVAMIVLKLKGAMGLDGDFTVIYMLAQQVLIDYIATSS